MTLRRVALIVNPAAGAAPKLVAALPAIKALLTTRGYRFEAFTTDQPERLGLPDQPERPAASLGSARMLAAHASQHAELVIACGGDGTVHEVVQGVAGTQAALGVLPLGTANALARNLQLPADPLAALARLLTYTPRTIPLGEIATSSGTRFFVVLAGCGPDGALVHSLASARKARLGRSAYYTHAARLFLTRRWPAFQVHYRLSGSTAWHTTPAVAILAARVADLGGAFSGLTPRASLLHPHLDVHLLRPPAELSLPAWFALRGTGLRARLPNPWLTTLDADELTCEPLDDRPVYMQADAEPLGALPCSLRMATATLRLLMPPRLNSAV